MPFWTYLLHCADRTFYTGHTDDLEKRVAQHELGLVPGSTETRRPVTLVWSQEFATRDEAREAERRIKGWGKPKKLALIRGDWDLISTLAKGKERASTSSAKLDEMEAPRHKPAWLSPSKPSSFFLHPHLQHLPTEPFSLEARIRRTGGRLRIRFRLTGNLDLIRIPQPTAPAFRDNLWQHTCFELFTRKPGEQTYREHNFSPSGEWAAYGFTGWRTRMTNLQGDPPQIRVMRDRYALELSVSVPLPDAVSQLDLSLTAVIEEKSGRESYWALAHPPGDKPDFHHPACFVLELPPPAAS